MRSPNARAEACRRVGRDGDSVAAVARDVGVGWHTIMRAVADHDAPLEDDSARTAGVRALGVDETSFLRAGPTRPTRFVTRLVDLRSGRLLHVDNGRAASVVSGRLAGRDQAWLSGSNGSRWTPAAATTTPCALGPPPNVGDVDPPCR